MLRKFLIFTFLFTTTISVISIYTDSYLMGGKRVYYNIFEYRAEYGTQLDWVQIFIVGLAVVSLVGIFVFKEDSKSDFKIEPTENNKTDINKNEVEYFDSETGEPLTNNTQPDNNKTDNSPTKKTYAELQKEKESSIS
tara:strand:- start:1388 stop:1801 length:414 start_codon:yes stop_codon:yes gene_type:complete